jgi:hypothetical protein
MSRLSAIVFIFVLLFTPSCKFLREKGIIGKKAKTLESLLAQQDSIRVADSLKKVQEELLALENEKLDSAKHAEEARLALESGSKYNIIVGSFITPEYAQGLSQVYRQRGYDTKILRMDGSRFELVAAESHENLRKAITRLKEFQDTIEIDAWIFIKE